MYFCEKCNFMYDITNLGNLNKEDISIDELFINIKGDISKYNFKFSFDELKEDSRYKKLSKKLKSKIEENFKDTKFNIGFSCTNCGNIKVIKESKLLYKHNKDIAEENDIEDDLDYSLIAKDPTLPRTKDYECKNVKCPTLKNPKIKEAVFVRKPNSYNNIYVCTVCNHYW